MSIDLDNLRAGSIVRTYDNALYVKGEAGSWHHLSASNNNVMDLRDLFVGELVHEAKNKVMEQFKAGDVISIGRRISATRSPYGFWEVSGVMGEFTNEELVAQFVLKGDTVRKIGSING